MIPKEDYELASGHIQIFKCVCAATALVMLFLSPIKGNKQCAEEAIGLSHFTHRVTSKIRSYSVYFQPSIVLEFGKLLTRTSREDPLYISCRNTLAGESEGSRPVWSQYLAILKELNSISKLYHGSEDKHRSVMMSRRSSLYTLIRYTKRSDEHRWSLEHKNVTDFESRRHLAMMMFLEVKDECKELHEMLIDLCAISDGWGFRDFPIRVEQGSEGLE
ncbi:hypothetical protein NE237_010438 [Protea cynaroides]|uniref:Uncharacterized protein n=1 Tax=Protea cynaroides TaxID=273540 RepID=A0A9Q0KZB8_9MAGN|nr:hypothetical protein NE237_010438 [Protea cynaroides]